MKNVVCLLLACLCLSAPAQATVSDDDHSLDVGLKDWRQMIHGPETTLDGVYSGFQDKVVISDLGTMKRTGHCETTTSGDDFVFTGSVGFTDLKISGVTMPGVELGGVPLKDAVITSSDNSIDVEYKGMIKMKPTFECAMSWKKFQVAKFADVKMNGHDVTEEFNQKVLPKVNEHLNSQAMMDLLNAKMTPCSETPLRKLFWGV